MGATSSENGLTGSTPRVRAGWPFELLRCGNQQSHSNIFVILSEAFFSGAEGPAFRLQPDEPTHLPKAKSIELPAAVAHCFDYGVLAGIQVANEE
jgi:hypothetical protein